MAEFSDLGLFSLFLFKAVIYALAGGVVMGLLDTVSHIWWEGKVTKKQYLWSLGVSFLLGIFVQWQDIQHQLAGLKDLSTTKSDVQNLTQTINDLRNSLQEKSNIIQDLRREKDVISAKMETASRDNILIIEQLRRQSGERDQQLSELKNKFDEREKRKRIHDHLGGLLAEGEQLKLRAMRNVNEPPPFASADKWVQRVNQYLEKEVSHVDAVQFLNPPMMPSYSFNIPKDHENMVNGMEPYLVVLRQITKQLESDIRVGGR